MTDAMMEDLAKERVASLDQAVQWFVRHKRSHNAMQRRGRSEEVASVVAFLGSGHANYINGSNCRMDGGAAEPAFG